MAGNELPISSEMTPTAGTTPMLELYTTLSRSEEKKDELILEENVDGMDVVMGTMFADAQGGSGTDLTLRLGYYLPGECCCTLCS